MIRTFKDSRTATIFAEQFVKGVPQDVCRRALHQLRKIDAATGVDDLRLPPGNRLEKLSGERRGQYSIRVNRQWRICFRWRDDGAYDVEFVDYH
tara:strand:- start:26 stop:307 length:282 start_codon:yes stop_codon:yes gene_type:complete